MVGGKILLCHKIGIRREVRRRRCTTRLNSTSGGCNASRCNISGRACCCWCLLVALILAFLLLVVLLLVSLLPGVLLLAVLLQEVLLLVVVAVVGFP